MLDAVPRLDVFVWGEPVEPSSLADEVEAYLRAGADGPGQVLAALMFTDIVRSTGSLSVDSDYEWRQLVHAFHRIVARQVARYSGVVVTVFGDGTLARFSCSYSAARCAFATARNSVASASRSGPDQRAGEVEIRGSDVSGITVHIASRICSTAG